MMVETSEKKEKKISTGVEPFRLFIQRGLLRKVKLEAQEFWQH